jgi:hypothetical protein
LGPKKCCACVLGFYRKKCARKGGQKVDKWGVLFKGNASPTVPEFSNTKIENRHHCCARVLGFYRKKCALKGGQDLDGMFE